MGLHTKNGNGGSGKIYLKIANGKITREWNEEPKSDWVPIDKELKTRTVTKGKNQGATRWYIEYDEVSGFILNVEVKNLENSNIIELYLQEGPDTYIITIPEESAYGRDFLMKMKNIDITKELFVSPWLMTAEEWLKLTGKKRQSDKVGLSLYLGESTKENAVKPYYTKDNPNGLPPLEEKVVKGKNTYDSTNMDNFLYDELMKWVSEVNAKLNGPSSTKIEAVKEVPSTSSILVSSLAEIDEDDLPF